MDGHQPRYRSPSKTQRFQLDGGVATPEALPAGLSTPLEPIGSSAQPDQSYLDRIRPGTDCYLDTLDTPVPTFAGRIARFQDQFSTPNERHRLYSPPPQTFTPTAKPMDIVCFPHRKHSRFSVVLKPNAPLYTGGTNIDGEVYLAVDGSKLPSRRTPYYGLSLGHVSVDLIGVETCCGRHHIFQSLALNLVDGNRPPPVDVLASSKPSPDMYWHLLPAEFSVPFQLSLPLDPGPPPFKSRHASIRYVLCVTALIKIGFEESYIRDSCDITVLTLNKRKSSKSSQFDLTKH